MSNYDGVPLSVVVELVFPSVEHLDQYQYAISLVRLRSSLRLPSRSSSFSTTFDLSRIKNEFLMLSQSIYANSALLAQTPVHTLPPEILSLIFVFSRTPPEQCDLARSPLLFLWVCSRWRHVAIETPVLWRDLSLNGRCRPECWEQIFAWLTRAKTQHVALALTFSKWMSIPRQYLHSSSDAVRTLALSLDQSQLPTHFGQLFPSLEVLSLKLSSLSIVQFRMVAPLLRSLSITARWVSNLNDGFLRAFPWSQLTTLDLRVQLGISSWIPIFTQCRELQFGRFQLWVDSRRYSMDTMTLPYLTSLQISFRYVCDTRFLFHIALPAIQELHISGIFPTGLNSPLMPDYSTLHKLSLPAELPQRLLQPIVERHPNLEQLALFTDASSNIPLSIREGHLPKLSKLTISTYNVNTVDNIRSFAANTAQWFLTTALNGCTFRFFSRKVVLEQLHTILAQEQAMQTSIELDQSMEGFDDPLLFPYDNFLCVRRRQT